MNYADHVSEGEVMLGRNRVAIGDVRDLAGRLEKASVQTIVTSPPYYGLRDYGTATWEGGEAACDHLQTNYDRGEGSATFHGGRRSQGESSPNGQARRSPYRGTCARCGATRVDKQLGLEATPAEYVANLVAVFRALRPALKDDGTIWLNLGDSYAGGNSGQLAQAHSGDIRTRRDADQKAPHANPGRPPIAGYPPKCLLGIPWRVAFALVDDGWILRSDIIWAKPAPMPESVTDRPTRSHEYLFLLSKRPNYYYDQEAIREPHSEKSLARYEYGLNMTANPNAIKGSLQDRAKAGIGSAERLGDSMNPAGRNKRSVWRVNAAKFPDAHYATFPEALIRPCVLAGTSERGECAACGRAWARVVERGTSDVQRENYAAAEAGAVDRHRGLPDRAGGFYNATATTTGWAPQCSCNAPTRPQVVLDPFCGSGTTWQVAHEEGRDFIGIDLDERALTWAANRLAKLPIGRIPGL